MPTASGSHGSRSDDYLSRSLSLSLADYVCSFVVRSAVCAEPFAGHLPAPLAAIGRRSCDVTLTPSANATQRRRHSLGVSTTEKGLESGLNAHFPELSKKF